MGLAGAGAALMLAGCSPEDSRPSFDAAALAADGSWSEIRAQFELSDDIIDMSAMLIASHPRPVREAIERHRSGLDRDPVRYLEANYSRGLRAARAAAGDYLGVRTDDIALTDSTTMSAGLVYSGMQLGPGDEILSTQEDYYVTIEALRQLSERTGAHVVQVPLYERADQLSAQEAVARILRGITPRTRLVALTWVHSSTGYKIPAAALSAAIDELNRTRPDHRQILFALDGVHGFGVENFSLGDLGCDFFMAGCHKWLFGPRGTGIIAAGPKGYAPLLPSIPSFIETDAFDAWILGRGDPGPNSGARMTPGGFKTFEHHWALADAFEWQRNLGKQRVAARTHELAAQLKDGLSAMPHVTVYTPRGDDLSSGIVAFDIDARSSAATVRRLRERNIIASVAPYATPRARLTPSIRNSPAEIDAVLDAIRDLT